MKVCYISVYRDGTGYANHAVNNMLAMDAGGIDVVARSIILSQNTNRDLANRVKHLESKNTDKVDAVVQHLLPHHYEYKHGVKNIGFLEWETTDFRRSNWSHCCNLMDEIWVSSLPVKQAAKNSNVNVPIKVIPCPIDKNRFLGEPRPFDIPQLKNKCVFYFIGEMTRRKNIIAILRAYYKSFSSRDDVALVIKTNIPGKSQEESKNILESTIDDIKKSIHMYVRKPYYPPVLCVTNFLPDRELDRLHQTCDVFVSASHGEAWGIPTHDAMGFGNPVVLSNWGSFPEMTYAQAQSYWNPENNMFDHPGEIDVGWLVDGQLTPCFGHTDSFPDLYTGEELWFEPDINMLSDSMSLAYKDWCADSLKQKQIAAHKRAIEFSYDNVGKIAKEILTETDRT